MISIPLRTDAPMRIRPWMNWLVILANFGIFIYQQHFDPSVLVRYELNANSLRLLHFITYAFLHLGWAHLLPNMLILFILGNNVNDRMGQMGYLSFYLAGAIFSGIGFLLTGGQQVVGASGAAGAVMGAYLVLFPRSTITMSIRVGVLEVPSMYFILIYFIYNLIMSLLAQARDVAYAAHLAGMVFGFAVALVFLATRLLPRQPFDFLALSQRWWRRRQYQGLVARGYNPFTLAAPPDPTNRIEERRPIVEAPDPNVVRASTLRVQVADAIGQRNLPLAAALFRELKAIDPQQFLSRQAQLDVANQLASEQRYIEAADAYEQFLRHYPGFDQIEEVQLMLGLIYARYLARYARARECLTTALEKLHGERKVEMARTELAEIDRHLPRASAG
jgi:membrane associated rhomboid family serine protease